jgi:hypothetical protein
VILPRKTVLEMQRLLSGAEGAIEMRFASNQAKFSFDSMEFVTKLVEGKFPDYNRVIPKNHKNAVTLGRAPLLASLQRTAILTSEKFKGVRLNIEPGTLRVASNNAEQEEAVDELDIDYGGDAIEIGFNVTYLIDALATQIWSVEGGEQELDDAVVAADVVAADACIWTASAWAPAVRVALGGTMRKSVWPRGDAWRKPANCVGSVSTIQLAPSWTVSRSG